MKNIVFYISLTVIVLMHGIGFCGILWGDFRYYINLTWVNLVVTGIFFLLYSIVEHWPHTQRYLLAFVIVCISGFLVEVLGVQSGRIFGIYQYGPTLGYKLWNVPMVIGLNWGLLVFACAGSLSRFYSNTWVKAAIGATLMTLLDILIEPVASHFFYWTWDIKMIPLQNFVAWWIVSFLMLVFCFVFVKNMQNRLGIWVYMIQLVFFTLLNLQLQ